MAFTHGEPSTPSALLTEKSDMHFCADEAKAIVVVVALLWQFGRGWATYVLYKFNTRRNTH